MNRDCIDVKCVMCDDSFTCIKCEDGSFLFNDGRGSISCVGLKENCIDFEGKSNKCEHCAIQYRMVGFNGENYCVLDDKRFLFYYLIGFGVFLGLAVGILIFVSIINKRRRQKKPREQSVKKIGLQRLNTYLQRASNGQNLPPEILKNSLDDVDEDGKNIEKKLWAKMNQSIGKIEMNADLDSNNDFIEPLKRFATVKLDEKNDMANLEVIDNNDNIQQQTPMLPHNVKTLKRNSPKLSPRKVQFDQKIDREGEE